jgi:hypothetical protein
MRALQCDRCGVTSVNGASDHWLHVEGWDIIMIGKSGNADFCTYACLIQWAIAEQARKVAAK